MRAARSRSRSHARLRFVPFAAAALSTLAIGCGSTTDPYARLSGEAAAYVIPGSEAWSSGEFCPDGGACSGPVTVDVIERYDWYRIAGLTVPSDGSTDGTITASLRVEEARPASDPEAAALQVRLWGPDADDVQEVIADGFDVWAGVDPDLDYVAEFIAFDDAGRVGGIGNAAAERFTIPVAELAAEARAPSGFLYLDPLMSSSS